MMEVSMLSTTYVPAAEKKGWTVWDYGPPVGILCLAAFLIGVSVTLIYDGFANQLF